MKGRNKSNTSRRGRGIRRRRGRGARRRRRWMRRARRSKLGKGKVNIKVRMWVKEVH